MSSAVEHTAHVLTLYFICINNCSLLKTLCGTGYSFLLQLCKEKYFLSMIGCSSAHFWPNSAPVAFYVQWTQPQLVDLSSSYHTISGSIIFMNFVGGFIADLSESQLK